MFLWTIQKVLFRGSSSSFPDWHPPESNLFLLRSSAAPCVPLTICCKAADSVRLPYCNLQIDLLVLIWLVFICFLYAQIYASNIQTLHICPHICSIHYTEHICVYINETTGLLFYVIFVFKYILYTFFISRLLLPFKQKAKGFLMCTKTMAYLNHIHSFST